MKNMKLISLTVLSLLALQVSVVGCDSPKQRPEVVDKEIQPKMLAISEIHDVAAADATKAFFYKTSASKEIEAVDKTKQIKLNEDTQKILDQVKKPETKAALDAQLQSGLIAFAVLPGELKIYKVLTKTQVGSDSGANSAKSVLDIKRMKKTAMEQVATDSGKMSVPEIETAEVKSDVMLVELTSVKIAVAGVIENKKTKYYDEKTSLLTVAERPLDLSTHVVLDAEVGAEATASAALKK